MKISIGPSYEWFFILGSKLTHRWMATVVQPRRLLNSDESNDNRHLPVTSIYIKKYIHQLLCTYIYSMLKFWDSYIAIPSYFYKCVHSRVWFKNTQYYNNEVIIKVNTLILYMRRHVFLYINYCCELNCDCFCHSGANWHIWQHTGRMEITDVIIIASH